MAVIVPVASKFDDSGIKAAKKAFGGLSSSLKSTIGALGIGLGLTALVSGLKDAAKAATEDIKSQALLAQQLKNTLGATDDQIAGVEKSISAMQMQASVADDVIRPAFASLVRATGDVGKATALTSLALDVAAGTGKDLGAVSLALGKAVNGNSTSLTKLVPSIKGASNPMAELAKQFDGAAAAAANNDPFQRMSIVLGEMQEQLGAILLPMLNDFAAFLASADFGKSFSDMIVAIKAAAGALDVFFQGISGKGAFQTLVDVAGAAAVGIAEIAFWLSDVGTTIGYITSGQWDKAGNQMVTYFDRYNKFVQNIYAEQDKAAKNAGKYVSPFNFKDPVIDKTKAAADASKKAADAAKKAQADLVAKFKSNITELAGAFKPLGQITQKLGDFEQQAVDSFQAINDAVAKGLKDKALTQAAADYIYNYIKVEKVALTALARQRDVLLAKIAIAKDISAGVVNAVNITALLTNETRQVTKSVKTLVNGIATTISTTYDEVITGNLADSFKKLVDKTKNFAKNLTALKKLGLNGTLFKQIVDAGAEAGGATAEAIIAGGADTVSELNTLFDDLNQAGSDIAKESTDTFYNLGEGVSNAFIDGLKSQEQTLADEIAKMVASIEEAFKLMMNNLNNLKNNQISVPASSLDTFQYAQILAGAGNPLTAEDIRFANIGQRVGATVNVTVNAGLGTNGKAVGQQITSLLNQYTKANA